MDNDSIDQGKAKAEQNQVLSKIYENYAHMNRMMVNEIEIASKHHGLTGSYRENMWMKFFRSIIPLKYSLAQGVLIIDSKGNVSNEVDIAVFDEQYTPYVFQYNTLKFIPIEAVVMVIECKSTTYDPEALRSWSTNINKLDPQPTGIARMATGYSIGLTNPTQCKTRPIRVLAAMKKYVQDQKMEEHIAELGDAFDFIILEKQLEEKRSVFEVSVPNGDKQLGWWGDYLNKKDTCGTANNPLCFQHLSDKTREKINNNDYPELKFDRNFHLENKLNDLIVKGNPLLTLNLQINQLLMLLNNPMLFPHFAYAQAFNKAIKTMEDKEKANKTV